MAIEIYNTHTLMGVMRELESPSSYWLDLLFPYVQTFDTEYIDFEKIDAAGRRLAPFVAPNVKGRPVMSDGFSVTRFKPAYVKPKDPVNPSRALKRRAGEAYGGSASPESRIQAIIADTMQTHRDSIERRWEWMAAQVAMTGKVVVSGDDYPEVTVDFSRAAGHTITLGVGARWGDTGISIVDYLTAWQTLMLRAPFGGPCNRITIGVDAWDVMRKDPEVLALLNMQTRGTVANLDLGPRTGEVSQFVGHVAPNLPVYVYSDYYHDAAGNVTPFMDPKAVVLTSSRYEGTRAFGAILDHEASYQATPIFPKMWSEQDPSGVFIMNQSAPLMIPGRVNASLYATVIA